MLTASEEAIEDKDTIPNIDSLIARMKTQKLSDDNQIPPPPPPPLPTSSTISNTTINNAAATSSSCSSSSSSSSSFDFNFDNKSGYAADGMLQIPPDTSAATTSSPTVVRATPTTTTTSMPTITNENRMAAIPLNDFHFSFTSSSSPSSIRSRSYSRRHNNRSGLRRSSDNPVLYSSNNSALPHPLSQATYPTSTSRGGGHDDDDDDDYESDIDIIEAQILRASSPSKQTHLLNRKILPLPKPRWSRKAGAQKQQQSLTESIKQQPTESMSTHPSTQQPSSSTLVSYMWPFSPPILESSVSSSSSVSQPQQSYPPAFIPFEEIKNYTHSNFGLTDLKNILLEHEIHNVGDPVDASYRDNTKKIKRCGDGDDNEGTTTNNNDSEERKGGLRRKDRRWKNNGADDRKGKSAPSPLSSPAVQGTSSLSTQPPSSSFSTQFPATSFNFTMDSQTKEKLKQLPKLDNVSPASTSSLGLSNVLRRTLSQKVDRMESITSTRLAIKSPTSQPPPLPTKLSPNVTHNNNNNTKNTVPPSLSTRPSNSTSGKKKSKESQTPHHGYSDKPTTTTTKSKSSSSKRGKKSQRKKKTDEDHVSTGNNHSNNNNKLHSNKSSDVAVVRSTDPDEWICVFCQYEIFCNGLETARRKGGYYRRRRERQRRLREMEARRAGECISGPASDVDDGIDEVPPPPPALSQQQQSQSQHYVVPPPAPPGIGGSVGTGPPPGLVDHRRRGRESRAA
ncbi:hypothetical protein BDA99DRAFT_526856 [Phascolomyces articulosus]|uniref:Uncharacterized protein n=1 Tax=Phascolomyces articulosus TaxID=60185 RepID=A0AAD5JYM0_9FUNG|nr:hypothetical protein BDA99DRAFT_526856 [Phascolomyces articulosus]